MAMSFYIYIIWYIDAGNGSNRSVTPVRDMYDYNHFKSFLKAYLLGMKCQSIKIRKCLLWN